MSCRYTKFFLVSMLLLIWVNFSISQLPSLQDQPGFNPQNLLARPSLPIQLMSESILKNMGDSLNVSLVGRWANGPCYAIAIVGDTAYFGNGAYLEIVDFSNPARPIELGKAAVPTRINDIVVSGNYAYLANFYAGLQVIDISDPAQPQPIGNLDVGQSFKGVAISAKYVYAATANAGLWVIDISDPAQPQGIGHLDTRGSAEGIALSGSYAYIADWFAGLDVIDISNPQQPQEVGFFDTDGYAKDVAVSGAYAYVADYDAGLRVIDISVPNQLKEIGYLDTGGEARSVALSGSHAYMADGSGGLRVINISTPQQPLEVGHFNTGAEAEAVAVSGNYAYVADADIGVRMIDISTPGQLRELGHFNTGGQAEGVAINGSYVYVADGFVGLRVIDISNQNKPQEIGYVNTAGNAEDVAISGDYAYVADGSNGLRIIDISDASQPLEVGYCDTKGYARDVAVSGSFAYVADRYTGFHVINIANSSQPQKVGYLKTAGHAKGIAVKFPHAFVAADSAGLRVIDVSISNQPQEVGYFNTDGAAEGIAVSGSYAYVADGDAGLRVIDISVPARPLELGYFDTEGYAKDVAISGAYVYVADYGAGLRVIDISTPDQPQEVGYFDSEGYAKDVAAAGAYAYLADGTDGLYILRYLNFNNPPAAPPLASPNNNAIITDDTPSLHWQVPVDLDGDPLHFKVDIASDNNFIHHISGSPFQSQVNVSGFCPTPPLLPGSGSCSYTIANKLAEGNYWWRVSAYDGKFYGALSEIWKFTINLPPYPPQNLTALPGNQHVKLCWKPNSEADISGYIIYCSQQQNFIPTSSDSIGRVCHPDTTFDHSQLTNGVTYYYRISAVDSIGNESDYSQEVVAAPSAPGIYLSNFFHNFGSVLIDNSEIWILLVYNIGTAPLFIDDMNWRQPAFTLSDTAATILPNDSFKVTITFKPARAQIYSDTLILVSNDSVDSVLKIILLGQGVTHPEPKIAASFTSYHFGDVLVDSSKHSFLSIKNVGIAPLVIDDMNWRQSVFSLSDTSGVISPNDSLEINISFRPDRAGDFSDTLKIFSNDPSDSILSIPISGNGIEQPQPKIALLATGYNFGDVIVDSTKSWLLTIKNIGASHLTIDDINWHQNVFSLTDTTALILPNDSFKITISFKPDQAKTFTDTLKIFSNDPVDSILSIQISGTGIEQPQPKIALSGTSYNFGDVIVDSSKSWVLTIKNIGASHLTIDDINWHQNVFSLSDTSGTISPDESLKITITFHPIAARFYSDTLRILSNDPDQPEIQVMLSGRGIMRPAPRIRLSEIQHEFGAVLIDSLASWKFNINNIGTDNLIIQDISWTESAFSISQTTGIVPEDSSLEIAVTFQPDQARPYFDTLKIASNDPSAPLSKIILSGNGIRSPAPKISIVERSHHFGDVIIHRSSEWNLIIKNVGTAALNIDDINWEQSVFSISDTSATILAADSFSIAIRFQPDAEMIFEDTLKIISNDPIAPLITIALSGRGITLPAPDINLSESFYDFGDVIINDTQPLTFNIENVGFDTLIIYNIIRSDSAFSISDINKIIPENSSAEITVTFKPLVYRSYTDTLKIFSNDPDETISPVILIGKGIRETLPIPQTIAVKPNPFTPNDDGYNDYVEFKYPEMDTHSPTIKIFNLRGQKVREIRDHSDHEYRWYGKDDDGKELEPGVYIYILEVNGKNISSGTITLVR